MLDFQLVRTNMLELHRQLLQAERITFESQHGRVTANQFFAALTSDPAFSWLAPLNAAIVRFDELLDAQTTAQTTANETADPSGPELTEHLAWLRDLLELRPRDDDFGRRYAQLVQNNADVAFAHAALAHSLTPRACPLNVATAAPATRPSWS
jgi:hypothetical protein